MLISTRHLVSKRRESWLEQLDLISPDVSRETCRLRHCPQAPAHRATAMETPRLRLSSTDVHRRPLTSIGHTAPTHHPLTAFASRIGLPQRMACCQICLCTFAIHPRPGSNRGLVHPALSYRAFQESSHPTISHWQATDTRKEKNPDPEDRGFVA